MTTVQPTTSRPALSAIGQLPVICAVLLVFTIAVVLVGPWGDYPVNDDWQYSRIAKRFAAGEGLKVDVPIAPSLVGQVVAVWPVIRLFGFSHVVLRCTTLLSGCVLLLLLDRLLIWAEIAARERFIGLCTIALNPLFFNLSASFMTEIYASVPVLLGAWLWFGDIWGSGVAAANEQKFRSPGIRWWVAALVGVLCGASFWIRQFAVLALPALWVAALIHSRPFPPLKGALRLLAPIVVSAIPAIFVTAGYFVWADAAGALRPEFVVPLSRMTHVDGVVLIAESGSFETFLALSCLPLLLLTWSGRITRRGVIAGVLLALCALVAVFFYRSMLVAKPGRFAPMPLNFAMGYQSSFPFIGNVFSESGVGPVTLSDVCWAGLPGKPHWWPPVWTIITLVALAGNALWVPALHRLSQIVRNPLPPNLATQLAIFGFAWSAFSIVAAVQSFQALVFDRYYFPAIIGMPVALMALRAPRRGQEPLRLQGTVTMSCLVLVGLAAVTISGAHNYFRWNDARWELYRRARSRGVEAQSIEAGYEAQGWEAFDIAQLRTAATHCIGPCRCIMGAYCIDDSYRVSMNAIPGYHTIDSIPPGYWLATGPPVLLLQREY